MSLVYKKATLNDLKFLVETRIVVLQAANKLDDSIDLTIIKENSYNYYKKALADGSHIAYLVFNNDIFVSAGGVSFFKVMPTYHNPTGYKAYIMNMYTDPNYRRQGIAFKVLDLLITASKLKGNSTISLEATDMGFALYKKYGFAESKNEMEYQE